MEQTHPGPVSSAIANPDHIPFSIFKQNKQPFMTNIRLLHKTFLCVFFLLVLRLAWWQDKEVVKGTITDEKAALLSGATIKVKGAAGGVNSYSNVNLTITIPALCTR